MPESTIPEEIKKKLIAKAQGRYGDFDMHSHYSQSCFISGGEAGYSLALKELEELREWKRQAIEVMPDFQAIGKEIDVKLGEPVHDKIVDCLKARKAEIKRLVDETHVLG